MRARRRAGIDIFRVFDSLNYLDNLRFGIDAVHAAGGVAEGTICYTGDILNPVFHPKVPALLHDPAGFLPCTPHPACRLHARMCTLHTLVEGKLIRAFASCCPCVQEGCTFACWSGPCSSRNAGAAPGRACMMKSPGHHG